jgi:hypothetical protein
MEKMEQQIIEALKDFINEIDSLIEVSEPIKLISRRLLHDQLDKLKPEMVRFNNLVQNNNYKEAIKLLRKIQKIERLVERIKKSTDLSPKITIVSFVIVLDYFLRELTRISYKIKPSMINQSQRKLSFAEISDFDHIEDIRKCVIEDELDAIFRGNHSDIFKSIEQILSIDPKPEEFTWKKFIEITERRNLFVHCNGIVSNQYIRTCRKYGVLDEEITVGQRITADNKYLKECHSIIYEIGVTFSNKLLRKFCKDHIEESDDCLIKICYELLVDEKYELAKRILKFSIEQKNHSSDYRKRIMIINLSIAYKFSLDGDNFRKTIDSVDWSSCADEFKLCVHALRGEYEDAASVMRRVGVNHDLVKEESYTEWPAFNEFRKTQIFLDAFKSVFGKQPTLETR